MESSITIHQPQNAAVIARDWAQRLKFMIVNGQKLNDNEVFALAQYAAATGLNPFAQECWFIPGSGPCPGIAGWRKKAQEQIEYEARQAKMNAGSFWVEFEEAPADCAANPGDIAYRAILRDSVTMTNWRKEYFQTAQMFKELGEADYLKRAEEMIGKAPQWSGVGVVSQTESFGRTEKFDRHERAKKRAEKLAIRKRFPRIDLPESAEDADFVDVDFQQVAPVKDDRDEPQLLKELGYDDPVPATVQKPATMASAGEQLAQGMPLEEAALVKNSEGTAYTEIDTAKLTHMLNAMTKGVRENKYAGEELDTVLYKIEAAKSIIASR